MKAFSLATWCSLALVAVTVPFVGGCSLDAGGLHREAAAISRLENNVEAARRIQALGERVQHFSEDAVTQAYMQSSTVDERQVLLEIIAWSERGDGRFVPLLCYVAQTSGSPGERGQAAGLLGRIKRLPDHCRTSRVVWILGESLAREADSGAANVMAFALDEFLRNMPGYQIPNADRTHEAPAILGGVRIHTVDTVAVRKWWEAEGRAAAERGEFDEKAKE